MPSPRAAEGALDVLRSLEPGRAFAVTVRGTSMAPALASGDELALVRCGSSELRLGDLAVVDLPPFGLVVHRVLWVGGRAVRTRGDGSGRMDPPIPHDRVLGRVVSVRRDGRELLPGPAGRWARWLAGFTAAAARHAVRRFELAVRPPTGDSGG